MLKECLKRFLSLTLTVVIVLAAVSALVLPTAVLPANAESVTSGSGIWIADTLSYSYTVETGSDNTQGAGGTVNTSGRTMTITATSAKEYKGEGCDAETVGATWTATTVTVTNISEDSLKITSLSNTNVTVNGIAQGDILSPGATFILSVTSPANGTNATTVTGTVSIAFEAVTDIPVTFLPSSYVSYTINDVTIEQNSQDPSVIVFQKGETISLPAITAPEGYTFKGWMIGENLITTVPASLTVTGSCTVYPLITDDSVNAEAALFSVGNNTFAFWNDAMNAAVSGSNKIVVVNADVVLPDSMDGNMLSPAGGSYVRKNSAGKVEYLVPAGVTLLVPFDTGATLITNNTISINYEEYQKQTQSVEFRRLTLPSGTCISVYGKVSVASKVYCMSTGQSGPYGLLMLEEDSKVTFKSNSDLYAFGYIKGNGTIDVESGATVYESMFVADYPGSASNLNNLTSAGVFPFSKFTIRNVEANMTFYSGSSEKIYFNLYGTSVGYHDAWIDFIGSIGSNALFRTAGSVSKAYRNDRQCFEIHGTSSISGMAISISAFGVSINVNTADLAGIPIPFNYTIDVIDGVTTISENVIFSKGSEAIVEEGAEVVIASGKAVYVMDLSDDPQAVTAAKDASVVVNGKLTVNGNLYTSTSGADICSAAEGRIDFTNAAPQNKTVKLKTSGVNSTEVAVIPAKLHNGANHPTEGDYAVDEYTLTQGAAAGTTYYYCSVCDAWYDEQHEHPHVHTWNEPVIEWAADYSSVTATFVCADDETHVETVTDDTIIRELRDPQEGTNVYTYAYMAEFEGPDGNTYKPEHTETGLFAGWYKDAEFTEWYTEAPEDYQEAYAKLVDPNILRFAFQLKKSATVNDESTVIRTLSSVDTLNYKSVGFIVSYTDAAGNKKSHTFETTTVYSKITGTSDIGPFEYEPSLFSPDSTRFFAFNLTVPCDLFEIEIEYTPFWVTYDGTTVKGKTPTPFALSKYLKSSTNG